LLLGLGVDGLGAMSHVDLLGGGGRASRTAPG
jgi:hypothetical protein